MQTQLGLSLLPPTWLQQDRQRLPRALWLSGLIPEPLVLLQEACLVL